MTRNHFKLNPAGVRALLKSAEVGDALEEAVEGVPEQARRNAHAAGYEQAVFDTHRFQGRDRARVHVAAMGGRAAKAELNARALTRAFGSR